MTDTAALLTDWPWFSPLKLAKLKLPGLPITESAINRLAGRAWRTPNQEFPDNERGTWRKREKQGGGWEYHYAVLPDLAQARLTALKAKLDTPTTPSREQVKAAMSRDQAWAHYATLPDTKKQAAADWLKVLDQVEILRVGGLGADVAVKTVARLVGKGASTIHLWRKRVQGVDRCDWLPYLVDHRAGRMVTAECDPRAWEALKADWLRLERPTFKSCYRRLQRIAGDQHWNVPSSVTLQRRMDREIPVAVQVLSREGYEALKRLYPPQIRDRSHFHALEAVNIDGHVWDVWVAWPGLKDPVRACLVAIQDLYSGLIVAWRVDISENREAVRLTIGDMVEKYGIPTAMWLDNGRAFASKWITGGTPTRYRFKVKDDDPEGLLTSLGVKVHWAEPYHGQSKPIERAFRDLCDTIAKDPAFAGAWTGNRPDAKPENYRSKAVPLEKFLAVVADGIAEHNARPGRRSRVCGGSKSFLQAFEESYKEAPIRKAHPEQQRLWLLAAEAVKADKTRGAITLLGNVYWSEKLLAHRGEKLVVRFDPQDLLADLHVYRLDDAYIGPAPVIEAVGFDSVDAAQQHKREQNAWLKAQRLQMQIEKKWSIEKVADLLPRGDEPPAPESKVVRPIFAGNTALKPVPQADPQPQGDPLAALAAALGGPMRGLRLVD